MAETSTGGWRVLAGWAFILAPVGQIGGWTLMRLGGNEGAEPQTTIAHTVWLIGFLLLAVASVELYRRVRSRGAGQVLARVSLAVTLVSVAVSVAEPILYGFGTQIVYLGFLVLIVQLAVLRRISATPLGWRLLREAPQPAGTLAA